VQRLVKIVQSVDYHQWDTYLFMQVRKRVPVDQDIFIEYLSFRIVAYCEPPETTLITNNNEVKTLECMLLFFLFVIFSLAKLNG